jgi:hypothetical protein
MFRFVWDDAKSRSNRWKHGIDFKAAATVWDDSHHKIVLDEVVGHENPLVGDRPGEGARSIIASCTHIPIRKTTN